MTVNELISELYAHVPQEWRDNALVFWEGSSIVSVDYVTVNQADGTVRLS